MYAIESAKSNFCQNFALIGGIPHHWGGEAPIAVKPIHLGLAAPKSAWRRVALVF